MRYRNCRPGCQRMVRCPLRPSARYIGSKRIASRDPNGEPKIQRVQVADRRAPAPAHRARSRQAITLPAIDFVALDPVEQGLRNTADLGGDRFNSAPQRRILAPVFLHQPHRTLPDFGGKFVRLVHGSILSKVGASSKPGAIQTQIWQANMQPWNAQLVQLKT